MAAIRGRAQNSANFVDALAAKYGGKRKESDSDPAPKRRAAKGDR